MQYANQKQCRKENSEGIVVIIGSGRVSWKCLRQAQNFAIVMHCLETFVQEKILFQSLYLHRDELSRAI